MLALVFGPFWLDESTGEKKPVDPLGILLLGSGLFGVVFGLERGNSDGWGSFTVVGSLIGGVLLLLVYYLWERTRKRPFVRFAILILSLGVDFPFGYQAPLMMLAGTGMGLSFTPLAHGILSSVPEQSSGEASGISNATRELGGVFGIAIGGLIFESGSAIRTPADFGDHIVPALLASAVMIALGLASVLLFTRSRAQRSVTSDEAMETSNSGNMTLKVIE
ncbi:hypothetical protein ACFQWB_02475 [Paenibacillus thermoaerophilus]|uniref:Major Facilitator Superfamily protein n=1 Tax=Paenibacillus thermoaerophilus TaxID=1215385 RepID=A0ABW2V1G3_9BACL|nr:MFS transporter [Paenibacillus thermoaerophilus]TMV08100.1 MFS transporter [Paenibacillus thermoaerophilus]